MLKLIRLSLYLIFSLTTTTVCAQFPYTESFKNSTAPGINFGGAPSAFLTAGGSAVDPVTQAHIGTPLDANGDGYLRLTNTLNNQKGYINSNSVFPSTQGLTVNFEYYIYGGSGADGISFFLYDASAEPFTIGGFGGSLGYAQITTTVPTSPGVSKGYLAIGLDEFGNFSNPSEGRQGGIKGESPGSVTLRGKGDGAALTAGNYSYLTSIKTASLGFELVGNAVSRQPDSNSTGYRRVNMDLVPHPNGGYNITVKITRGGPTLTTTTVIDNFYYPEAAPANLKYGIASSTGDQTNFHEIRNVFIDVITSDNLKRPVALNDSLTVCQENTAVLDVSLNDQTSNAGGAMNKASIDLDPITAGIQKTITIAGKGVFAINTANDVTFTPEAAFIGTVTTSYQIKDNFGKTSNTAFITLEYTSAPPKPNAGSDQILSGTANTVTTTLQGNDPGAVNGRWTQVSGPNTAFIENSAQSNSLVSNLSKGVYIFRWTLSSMGGCELFDDVQVTVGPVIYASKIGLAKALTSRTRNSDGSYDLSYTFTLVNYGDVESITNISLTDDLESVFKNNSVIIKRLQATGSLQVNNNYNGFSVKDMLLPSSTMIAKSKEQVTLDLNVSVNKAEGTFNNTGFTQGILKDGSITSDESTDGLIPDPDVPRDVSPRKPTPVTLNEQELFIPGGFSPNNDGINDYFVIENSTNLQIQLEIFNRWGNRIYHAVNYKNEWNGKTTEGIHIGDDVPVGTYYYLIKIAGKNKKAGHLTINR